MRLAALMLAWLAACGRVDVAVVPCASLTAGCVVVLNQRQVQVRTDVAPAPLQPFQVTLRAEQAREVFIAFNMQGMEMGPNRYRLAQQADGSWLARVTLPVCVSGRRDWQMILEIDGRRVALPFQTG
jgi:hypothetical protein